MKRIIKLLLLVLLGMSVFGCELFDPKLYKEGDKAYREALERCKAKSGYRYCRDASVQTIFTY